MILFSPARKTPTYECEVSLESMSKLQLAAVLALIFAVGAGSSYAVFGTNLVEFSSSDEGFSISADAYNGTNRYVMVEVDEGDNNEEQQVEEIFHLFSFSTSNMDGLVVWDFADGTTATGSDVTHAFETPGHHTVTATITNGNDVETRELTVTVDLDSEVEVDNMECVCAPTAKDTIIPLSEHDGTATLEGYVMVEHDGSSESCALRNPLQECHLRVVYELLDEEQVTMTEVLFDDTFRSNELVVDFDFEDVVLEEGQRIQLRLETDQVRDWHKPMGAWTTTAPAAA